MTIICDWFEDTYELALLEDEDELSIGQLIEYLGDDLKIIYLNQDFDSERWEVGLQNNDKIGNIYKKELIDALWSATKYKLRKV